MRYTRDGKWTPVSFVQRLRLAGWDLLFPPLYLALMGTFVWLFLKAFFFIFPHLGSKPDPKVEVWLYPVLGVVIFITLLAQELEILNANTANIHEMVSTRLADLEVQKPY